MNSYRGILGISLVGLFAVAACDHDAPPDPKPPVSNVFSFKLDSGNEGWEAGFADYPVGEETFFELQSGWQPLPTPLADTNGILLSGNNHSDDLFMFIKRRVEGLSSNARYRLGFEIELATNADTGCAGVGGAPGESVFVKAGATPVEPLPVRASEGGREIYRMNIDPGIQSQGGRDAVVIGNVANTQTDCSDDKYELKRLNNEAVPFTVKTDKDGGLWLLLATDSAFEGTTSVFYTDIRVTANPD